MTEAHDETPPEANDPVTNNFTFGKDNDPHGFGCPFASHIRRTNPRQDPLAPSRRRPLFRRGIPYGRSSRTTTWNAPSPPIRSAKARRWRAPSNAA
ncbi:MAG: hypothetical protein U1F67_19375 [Rubrivivax sp.]